MNLMLTELSRLRNMYLKNPMICYLNINHFENKVINFREICHQARVLMKQNLILPIQILSST